MKYDIINYEKSEKMKSNRNIIITLTIIIIISITTLICLKLSGINTQFTESILISILSGCIVSIVMSYIEYKNKIEEEIDYFINEIHNYYFTIDRIDNYIKNAKKQDEGLYECVQSEMNFILKRNETKKGRLSFYSLFPNSKINNVYKTINEIYELTFGMELIIISIKTHKDIKELKKKNLYPKLSIECMKMYIDEEKKVINKYMLDIKEFDINKYWKVFLESREKVDKK